MLQPSGVRKLGGTCRVLVVDDDLDSAEVMCAIVTDEGHDVRAALSATEALAVVADFVPDVALIDIGLPGVTGYELVAALRAKPALASCRFIALTGYSGPALSQRSSEAGFEVHLTKPASVELILGVIAQRSSEKRDASRA